MAAPLIQLTDIALTFGGNSLLNGVDLAVGAGERICLVGRNGSGKSTLLKIAAGIIDPDRGTRFVQPGALVRYLPQEPDLSAYPTTLAYVEAGLSASDDPHQARYLLEQLGLTGNEDPAHLSGEKHGAPRLRMSWPPIRRSCCSTSPQTTWICPRSNGSKRGCNNRARPS